MTIDFKNNRIYHFDREIKCKEHKPISSEFREIEVLSDGRILIVEDYFKYKNGDKSNLYCLNQNMEVECFYPLQILITQVWQLCRFYNKWQSDFREYF
jgi:hypothetical protein